MEDGLQRAYSFEIEWVKNSCICYTWPQVSNLFLHFYSHIISKKNHFSFLFFFFLFLSWWHLDMFFTGQHLLQHHLPKLWRLYLRFLCWFMFSSDNSALELCLSALYMDAETQGCTAMLDIVLECDFSIGFSQSKGISHVCVLGWPWLSASCPPSCSLLLHRVSPHKGISVGSPGAAPPTIPSGLFPHIFPQPWLHFAPCSSGFLQGTCP